jgi:cyanate lyase
VYEAIGGAVNAFSDAAMSGQVYIEADAAADALAKIGEVKDQLDLLQTDTFHGATDVQLGANPVGQAMARKSMGRYDGSDSFMAAITLLSQQTAKAEAALKKCIDNYVDIDGSHAAKYHRA